VLPCKKPFHTACRSRPHVGVAGSQGLQGVTSVAQSTQLEVIRHFLLYTALINRITDNDYSASQVFMTRQYMDISLYVHVYVPDIATFILEGDRHLALSGV